MRYAAPRKTAPQPRDEHVCGESGAARTRAHVKSVTVGARHLSFEYRPFLKSDFV